MSDRPSFSNGDIAEKLMDKLEEIVKDLGHDMPIKFQELTADAGVLPRLMVAPLRSDGRYETDRYISGETIYPFPIALRFRQSIRDEQSRLDAHKLLTDLSKAITSECQALDGYVVCRRPTAQVPIQLGATNDFEDWEVTLDLIYKTTR